MVIVMAAHRRRGLSGDRYGGAQAARLKKRSLWRRLAWRGGGFAGMEEMYEIL